MSVASVLRIGSRCTISSASAATRSSTSTMSTGTVPRSFSVLSSRRLGVHHISQIGGTLKGYGQAVGCAPAVLGQQRNFHASAPTSASQQDPYSLLGVKKTASQAEIKKAYYGLAKQYHPDTNKDPAAREKFVQIQEAYEILSDEQKKAQYDEFGHAGFN
ncbi:hypothetical protein BGW38_002278, partial [Lunasporangiospora selenospora]